MKLRFASLAFLAMLVIAAPVMASTLYSNGPINGTVNAWNTCCGLIVSDSFVLSSSSTITSFDAGLWVGPGDSPASTSWAISAGNPSFLGGTVVAGGSGNYSNSLYCFGCGLGVFDIYTSTLSGLNVSLGAGTYYLELFNGLTAIGGNSSLFWDENNGPSTAYEYPFVTTGIPSQAFNIYGTGGTATPEPGTVMLLGSGVAGLAGMLRRKITL
jgi:hypothetical protein